MKCPRLIRELWNDSGKQSFVWLTSAATVWSIVLFGKKEDQPMTDALLQSGYAWVVFLVFGVIFLSMWVVRKLIHGK